MALTGTLRDFGIAEILQMIGTQKKTGVLSVEDDKRRAEIAFVDGMIVNAHGGEETVSLDERLVRIGMLGRDQLDAALKRVQETLKPLPAVLVSDGHIDPATLREIVTRHFSEIVYEIFDWKSGTYAFQQKFLQWDKQLVSPIPAESIMMEGLRIVDEGPGVRKLLPSLDDVYSQEDRSSEELEQMEPEMRQVYDLIDGRKTLKDIIISSNQPKFDAMKHLAWMRMNRFIVREKKPAGADRDETQRPERLTTVTLVALLMLLAVAAGVLAIRVGQSVWNFAAPLAHSEESVNPISTILTEARENRVRQALEVYKLRHGYYPDKLELLVQEKLVRAGDVQPLGREPFSYLIEDSGSHYLLGDAAKTSLDREGNPTP